MSKTNSKILFIVNIIFCLMFALATMLMPAPEPFAQKVPVANDSHNPAFFLINNKNPLPEDYEPELRAIEHNESFELDVICADYAEEMLEAAELDGVELRVVSAYRSRQKQGENFRSYVDRLMLENYSQSEALIYTAAQIAVPGASEHNAGLALDILSEDWFTYNDDITDGFRQTSEFKWLEKNSWKYGFILRYPEGKEDITGFIYEPWHYRFIGVDEAEQVYNSGLTLEEYIARYPNYPNTVVNHS